MPGLARAFGAFSRALPGFSFAFPSGEFRHAEEEGGPRIDRSLNERILACLADSESVSILNSVFSDPKSAADIERELGLTQSTLYRKISVLRECGLLMIDRFNIRPEGNKEAVYASSFVEIRFKLLGSGIHLEIVQNSRSIEKRWFELFFAKEKVSSVQSRPTVSRSST